MAAYSDLLRKIKLRNSWDKIFMPVFPRSRIIHEGYRINIELEKEEDIERAKAFLREAHIVFLDKKATSFSETVAPGDRTLRVMHQASVANLRRIWAEEFEKSPLGRALKKQQGGR